MSRIVDTFVSLDAADEPPADTAARALGWPTVRVGRVRVVRRSLDARKGMGRPIGFQLRLEVFETGESEPAVVAVGRASLSWPSGRAVPRVVIVGSGPAGTWAALRLADAGIAATILERGKPVQPRRHDLAALQRGSLNPDSNYCFGEGGAGTYSDGKLYTRSKDRAGVAGILADLVRFGAPAEIESDARPHVGSNRLPKVLTGLRTHLQAQGVAYAFDSEAVGVRVQGGSVRAVRLRGGGELPADVLVLAVGHSARLVYEWLLAAGIAVERKEMAVGVRLEHPQAVINRMQYGPVAGDARLPPAFYELKAQCEGRGVYSFCMCPGGWIVPAATEADGTVVNGMSLSRRDSPFANAGMVVTVRTDEFGPVSAGPLAGVGLQRQIEQAAFRLAGGNFRAPAQRLGDFLAGHPSSSLPKTSYRPGIVTGSLAEVFPPFVTTALRGGLRDLVRRYPLLDDPDAVLIAAETRTSAPVRIVRDPETLESPTLPGVYPSGEGAGYAGGIVSAALDGVRIAEAIVRRGG